MRGRRGLLLGLRDSLVGGSKRVSARIAAWLRWLRKRINWQWWRRARWPARLRAAAGFIVATIVAAAIAAVAIVLLELRRGVWRVVAAEAVSVVVVLLLLDALLTSSFLKRRDGPAKERLMFAFTLVVVVGAVGAAVAAALAGSVDPKATTGVFAAAVLALVVHMVLADRWRWHVALRFGSDIAVLAVFVVGFARWPDVAAPLLATAAIVWFIWQATSFLDGPLSAWAARRLIVVIAGGLTWWFARSDAGTVAFKIGVAAAVAILVWRLTAWLSGWRATRGAFALVVGILTFTVLRGFPSTGRGWAILIAVVAVVIVVPLALRKKPELLTLRPRSPYRSQVDATRRHARELTSDGASILVDAIDEQFAVGRTEFDGSTRPDTCPRGGRAGLRAVHSHGTFATGTFQTDPDAARILSAGVWKGPPVHAIVRFSNFDGRVARNDAAKGVHGMAISLRPPNVAGIDLVLMDIDRFFARTREDFLAFTEAFGTPGIHRRLYRLSNLVLFRRTTLPLVLKLIGLKRTVSYADQTYFGVNAFIWQIGGRDRHARAEAVPLSKRSPSRGRNPADPEQLHHELHDRFEQDRGTESQGTVDYRIELVLGDGLEQKRLIDAMTPWPRSQPRIVLGHLTLRDSAGDEFDPLIFDPHRLPEGVRPSADEILMARRAAYAESHVRRIRAQGQPVPARTGRTRSSPSEALR